MEIDSGTQTRLFHFGGTVPANQAATWQGYSAAEWEGIPAAELRSRKAGSGEDVRGGLRVITTRMRPGYLRKNGVPYSENARVEEHFDRFKEPNGDDWLVVDSIVTDPTYLTGPVHHERGVQEDSRPPRLGSHALPRQRSPLITDHAQARPFVDSA